MYNLNKMWFFKKLAVLFITVIVSIGPVYPCSISIIFPHKDPTSDPSRYPIFTRWQDGNTYVGYIDPAGKVVIPVSMVRGVKVKLEEMDPYDRIADHEKDWPGEFFEGRLIVRTEADRDYIYGYLDTFGDIAIIPQFKNARRFSEGLAAVEDPATGKWGYIDRWGNYVIEPRFNHILSSGDFHDGRAWFEENKLYGYMDAQGKQVIPAQFYESWDFSEGLARVNNGPPCWSLDERPCGDMRFWGMTRSSLSIINGLSIITEGKVKHCRYQLIDKSGKLISGDGYLSTRPSSEGLVAVNFSDTVVPNTKGFLYKREWGFKRTNGEIVVQPKYSSVGSFAEGLASVSIHRKWGYINTNGETVITPRFRSAKEFANGRAPVVGNNKKCWYINSKGEKAFDGEFKYCDCFIGDLAFVELNKSGEVPEYAYINHFGEIIFSFTENSLVPEPRDDIRQ
jgi:WG containing repeat